MSPFSQETIKVLDIQAIREEFPILHQQVNGKPLAYFDNAATTQKPQQVIDALDGYYKGYNANIHRGIHTLAEKATKAFEETRVALKHFLNAKEAEEIIFTKGTTEAINLVASTYGRQNFGPGDEIIISGLEHHSNIVPWQMVAEEKGAEIKVIPVKENGELDYEHYLTLLSNKTKLVAVNHASNSLGTINPIKEMISAAHKAGAKVLIDGAQASAHLEIDVQALDCDFYAVSAHKFYGPTGTGALYGKRELLEAMPPYQGGGEMIKDVSFEKATYNDIPYKFEAGTPNIADVAAFKEAIDFVDRLGKANIAAYENHLLEYATKALSHIEHIKLVGTAQKKVSVLSFTINGIHHFDIGQMLDARGVAVRTGHHCTQPLMERYGIEGTVRASFAVYNTEQEIDRLVEGLERIVNFMK
ncbi:Cysteine desulfurase, SufS subfamily [Fulvivirga imtechensis AK7]|uniref:Cysteine desulfurase n=1 Tax=Fulvivirga imtechensis AK7 TaxID=1237149 RepID=L8JNL0_9BACT|nr:cysteine desulfurase [Fulvivirga imtechensis]ELR68967.1 Cysteine desulfurase, SufS subfamily [Fulvivirga imtechensis AK7]